MSFIFYGYYCDDVRHEVSGKVSLIGCYGGEIWVNKLPFVFKRLHVSFVIEAIGADKVLPGQMRIVTEINSEEKGDVNFNFNEPTENITHNRLDGGYAIENLEITEPCEITSHLVIDGQKIRGPHAKINLKSMDQD